ncbi:MAG TPA: protein translocase subunit SecF, partial [Thermomonas sp.]|nr:protein translocase subunit SecF [Thermomonas sp.]HRA57976.1 protein translocase subunit SecF [Thermomonas sp.]
MKLFPLHLIPNDTTIDFMRHRRPVLALMLVLLVTSIAIIGLKGFNYALEFTGGTMVRTHFAKPIHVEDVRDRLTKAG